MSLPYAGTFQDLLAYKKARALAQEIFLVTQNFPREEMYSLTDQIRRSSRSIGAQIAEAWAKRRYERHFLSKLTDADGERQETQHWIDMATDCGYLSKPQAVALQAQCKEIGRLIGGMMTKSDLFCHKPERTVRESAVEYFITNEDN